MNMTILCSTISSASDFGLPWISAIILIKVSSFKYFLVTTIIKEFPKMVSSKGLDSSSRVTLFLKSEKAKVFHTKANFHTVFNTIIYIF